MAISAWRRGSQDCRLPRGIILKQAENDAPVADLCRKRFMSSASFYSRRSKYVGMDASLRTRMKERGDENKRLMKMTSSMSGCLLTIVSRQYSRIDKGAPHTL